MASSAFFDRIWCPARPPPIPDHGGLGEKGEKVASVCCEFGTQTMILDQKRFDGVMRQIFW